MSKKHMLSLLVLLALLLGACNLPNNDEEAGNLVLTAAAETVAAQLTADAANATPTPTTAPSDTPSPTHTPSPTNTIVPTNTQAVSSGGGGVSTCDSAGWVDETIPDGSSYAPGQAFTKTWTLRNDGTCTWTNGYKLIFSTGDAMGAPASKALTASDVAPGQSLTVSVDLTAPTTAGTYRGNFKLQNASGVSFGLQGVGVFWVEIKVTGGTVGPTITPGGPTLTPTSGAPSAYASSSALSFSQTQSINLDNGNVSTGGADLLFEFVDNDNKYLTPQNGAKILKWGFGQPSYNDCNGAATSGSSFKVNNDLVGQYACYVTSEGRTGFLYVKSLQPTDNTQTQTLDISFTTWE
jgi:hypothetical protein